MQEINFSPGETILLEGGASDTAFQILSGEVEIYTERSGQVIRLGYITTGDYLGEMGLIDQSPRSASARAITDVAILEFQRFEFIEHLSNEAVVAHRIITRLCDRLRDTNQRLVDSLSKTNPNFIADKPSDIRVTVFGDHVDLAPYIPPAGITMEQTQFSIGRADEGVIDQNDALLLPDSIPSRLSVNHFTVSNTLEGVVVWDFESSLGTEVNGVTIGYEFLKDHQTLKAGENKIVAGGKDSPFRFQIVVE
jgi:CRP-like cAMP-binding protein